MRKKSINSIKTNNTISSNDSIGNVEASSNNSSLSSSSASTLSEQFEWESISMNRPIQSKVTGTYCNEAQLVQSQSANINELDSPLIDERCFQIEMSNHNIKHLSGTVFDPERFLIKNDYDRCNYFDREVDPIRLQQFLINYMIKYYDLDSDPNAFSTKRQMMDEHLWDSLAYVIPLLCGQVIRQVLIHEPSVIHCESNSIIIGDIHGNLNDIYYIYRHYICNEKYHNYQFIFLGDYVDRGPKGVEVVCFLFTCKLIQPNRFILLRGNHEVSKVNKKYAFGALISNIFGDTYIQMPNVLAALIYRSFNQSFNHLPLAAVIKATPFRKAIFCCHGGIPNQSLKRKCNQPWTIREIISAAIKPNSLIPSKRSSKNLLVMNEILWNDPIPKRIHRKGQTKLFYKNRTRGGHCSWFTKEAVQMFLNKNKLELIIRGHQFKRTKSCGFYYQFNQTILTVFSSSNYSGSNGNVTGLVIVTDKLIKPKTLRHLDESRRFAEFNVFHYLLDKKTKVITDVVF
ncbi:hypothetical protein BLOT_007874 [Blomia tropicalis]|nr:hypothetical protein BLOT_007874 [Blomia tropicalis]